MYRTGPSNATRKIWSMQENPKMENLVATSLYEVADLLEHPDEVAQPHVRLQVGQEGGELGVQIVGCQDVGEHSKGLLVTYINMYKYKCYSITITTKKIC